MPKKFNQDFSTQFPVALYDSLSGLIERRLITETRLFIVVMSILLPALAMVEKNKPLEADEQKFCTPESWFNRFGSSGLTFDKFKKLHYNKLAETHTFTPISSITGVETLEVKTKKASPDYEVFCCGNGQDAMSFAMVQNRITEEPEKNHIFWNYPSVGSSVDAAFSVQPLFKAGYQQVKRLIDEKKVLAVNITLRGHSLGGAVATRVARQLHEEGHLVNLVVDRSFAQLAVVIPEVFKKNMVDGGTLKPSRYAPLGSSLIALSLFGLSLGTTFSGLVATVGLLTASTTAAIGYIAVVFAEVVGFLVQKIMTTIGTLIAFPFSYFSQALSVGIKTFFARIGSILAYSFNLTAFAINELFSKLALFINNAANWIASFAGGAVAIAGVIAGALLGLVFGMILSIQFLWTDEPLLMPMTIAFSAALNSTCCNMDSVTEMQRLLNADNKPENKEEKQPKITVINAIYDEVIPVEASLNKGLGVQPGKQAADSENRLLKERVTSFWYNRGGHNGALSTPIDSSLSYS